MLARDTSDLTLHAFHNATRTNASPSLLAYHLLPDCRCQTSTRKSFPTLTTSLPASAPILATSRSLGFMRPYQRVSSIRHQNRHHLQRQRQYPQERCRRWPPLRPTRTVSGTGLAHRTTRHVSIVRPLYRSANGRILFHGTRDVARFTTLFSHSRGVFPTATIRWLLDMGSSMDPNQNPRSVQRDVRPARPDLSLLPMGATTAVVLRHGNVNGPQPRYILNKQDLWGDPTPDFPAGQQSR